MKRFIFFSLIVFSINTLIAQNYDNCLPQNKEKINCNLSKLDDSDLFRKNERVVFLNTEFLYWTASLANNEYVFQYNRSPTSSEIYGLGKYVFSKYAWDPGFRVAIGWFNAPNTYQVIGQFIWIKIDNTNCYRKQPDDKPICGTFPQYYILGQELSKAESRIRLNHELGDFLASRVWIPNLHLRLRLFGGLTGGRVQQKWNIIYKDVLSQMEKIYNKWKFTGIGFRVGLDFDWFWSSHFYVTGKASFAPFVGKYKYLGQISSEFTEYAYFTSNQWRGVYNIQAYLGPSYQRSFTNNRFEIFIGYELNSWLNLNEIIRNSIATDTRYLSEEVVPNVNNGLLMLHGFNARLTLDF